MTVSELCDASHSALDLDGQVWTGAEMSEMTLEDSSMRRLRATGGRWGQCVLIDCDLEGADLAGLTARDCSVLNSRLDRSRLTGSAWLRGRWRDIDAEDVQADQLTAFESSWRQVTLRRWRLREADFTGAQWHRVHLIDCDLTGARFSGLRASAVRLDGCTLAAVHGIEALRGASLAYSAAVTALPAMASHLGIDIHHDPEEMDR